MKNKRILCISPHADDLEHGCGGSVSRFLEEGSEVYCASFSFSEESIPDGLPKDITEKEFYKSMETMGIDNTIVFKYPVRYFPTHRQDILEDLVKINKDIKPDLVLIESMLSGFNGYQICSLLKLDIKYEDVQGQRPRE